MEMTYSGQSEANYDRDFLGDYGLFGPRSISWRLHGDPSAFVGGIRALLLQALSQRSMRAVVDFSDYRRDPWGRLRRTSNFVMATTFQNTYHARRAIADVRAIHDRINGYDPDSDNTYSANSGELLAFIHNCFVDSMLVSYQSYVKPLSDAEQNRYLSEQSQIAELLGADMELVELSPHGLLGAIVHNDDLGMSDGARRAFADIAAPPFSSFEVILRPLWNLIFDSAFDLLPAFAKDLYAMECTRDALPWRRASVSLLAQVSRLILPSHPYQRDAKYRWYAEGASKGPTS